MKQPGKVEQLMNQFLSELNEEEQDLLWNKLSAARESREPTINLEEITPQQLRDPEFKKAVVSAIERATRRLG